MAKLTPKQQQIYDFILAFANDHGYPPSVREIALAVGLKSPATVHFHLKGLREAGVITQAEGKTRAISITDAGHNRKDQVPLVGYVAAGAPILAQENIEEYLTFDTGGLTGEHFALKVRGESMLEAGTVTSWWPCSTTRPPSKPSAGETTAISGSTRKTPAASISPSTARAAPSWAEWWRSSGAIDSSAPDPRPSSEGRGLFLCPPARAVK